MLRYWRWLGILSVLGVLLSACGSQTSTAPSAATTMPGSMMGGTTAAAPTMPMMNDTAMPMMEGTSIAADSMDGGMNAAPMDAQFLDSMLDHHRGALSMAQQALKESQRPEITQLAQTIITAQQREIDQMIAWRAAWFPDLAPTGGMSMPMGDMEISPDTTKPFDQRFISAMIAHHQGAITMAKQIQQTTQRPELNQLATDIVTAQEAEITQLQTWQTQWFGG